MPSTGSSIKPISIALGLKAPVKSSPLARKPLVANPSISKKRPHSSLADDSDEEDDQNVGAHTSISGFDHTAGGAIEIHNKKEEKKALVIPRQKNRDWREESRRRKGNHALPHEAAENKAKTQKSTKDIINGEPQAYGLTFTERKQTEDTVMVDVESATEEEKLSSEPPKPKTVDELAIEALTGKDQAQKSTLVLPPTTKSEAQSNGSAYDIQPAQNEEDAFRADVSSRPDSASLDDYAAVPIEEFGAALLRGMGWKEGDAVGKRKGQESKPKPRAVERRPALLGIGAKETPNGMSAEELGSWGASLKGGKKQPRKTQMAYSPVMLKNSVTGELVTEEELKSRQEGKGKGKEEEADWRERRDRNLERDREKKRGYGEERRVKDKDFAPSREVLSSRRDRSRSPKQRREDDERRDRKRDRDRDREKDRRRDDDYGKDRDRDRERDRRRRDEDKYGSSRHGGDGERGSDRDRRKRRERDGERHESSSSSRDYGDGRKRQEIY